jgi:hypothetical protein
MVPPLEQVTYTVMTPVEALRIRGVQPSHASREIGLRRFDQEMIVIAHEAVRVKAPSLLPNLAREERKKALPIVVIAEDHLTLIASGGQVIQGPCVFQTELSCHERRLDSLRERIKGVRRKKTAQV